MSKPLIPSLADIRNLLGKASVASWRSWFAAKSLPVASTTRDVMVRRLEMLFQEGDITAEALYEGRVEIEEAANKLVFLYQVDPNSAAVRGLAANLAKADVSTSASPILATPSALSKLVYAVNGTKFLRIKWVETHTAWRSQLPASPLMRAEKLLRLIVLVLNKETGRVQLRYDKPERDNPHKEEGSTSKEAYFSFYRERVEDICGLTLSEVELRPSMEKIINTRPWLVELGHNEQLTEDGFVLKYSAKVKGKDVRNGKHYTAGEAHSGTITTHEVESMTWLPDASHAKIGRKVFTHVNGRDGSVRFDSYCHEAELTYVLDHFNPS